MSLSSMADILRESIVNNRAVKRFKTLWSPTAVLIDAQGNPVMGDVRSSPGAHTVLQRLKDLLTGIVLAPGANKIGGVESVDPSDVTRKGEFDNKFKIPIFIDVEHHEIHEGDAYSVNFENDVTNTGEMTVIALNVPAGTKRVHMIFTGSATSLANACIYKDTFIDVDEGTQKTPINRDENSSNTSQLTSIETVPVASKVTTMNEAQAAAANITKTTEIWCEAIGQTGNPVTKSGGQTRGQSERILENGKQYAFVLDALDNNDNHHNIILDWYEHTDE